MSRPQKTVPMDLKQTSLTVSCESDNRFSAKCVYSCCTAIFAIALLTAGCSQKIDSYTEFVEVAYQHERKGELPEAVAAYRKALELTPDAAVTWYDMGVAYAGMEQFPEAIEAYTKAIEIDAGMAQSYNNRAAVYARLSQFDRAVKDCDAAISLQPDDFLPWRNRGLAYHDLGELKKAIADYDESIRLNGRVAETYHYRGNVYLEERQYERALEDFESAILLDEQMAAAWLSKAKTLARLGRREEADVALKQAETSGADIADVQLDEFDEFDEFDTHVAPVAQALEPQDLAIDFVIETLRAEGHSIVRADSRGVLLDQNDSGERFLVKLAEESNGQQSIQFHAQELQIPADNVRTTLLVVQQTASATKQDSSGSFRIAQRFANWTPDVSQMKPVQWEMSVDSRGEEPSESTSNYQPLSATTNVVTN